jgi:hypothetical protein
MELDCPFCYKLLVYEQNARLNSRLCQCGPCEGKRWKDESKMRKTVRKRSKDEKNICGLEVEDFGSDGKDQKG